VSTQQITFQHTAGKNVYISLWNSSGMVFDFADNTFKLLSAPPTTPYIALTEKTDMGGTGKSGYVGTLNLSLLNKDVTPLSITLSIYERAGGSPALNTDTVISQPLDLTIQCAELGDLPISVKLEACFTTTAGTTVRLFATLLRGGERVAVYDLDPTATLQIDVVEHTTG